MKRLLFKACFLTATILFAQPGFAQSINSPHTTIASPQLQLPAGFVATIVADTVGSARHMAVNKQGGLYIKLSKLKNGKGIIYLKDTNKDGKFEIQKAFGDYPGTGIFLKNGYLYASSNDDVYRYKLDNNEEVINPDEPEKIVVGLVNRIRDNSKAIVVDDKDNLYVNVGSYLTSCLVDTSTKQAPYPCPMLDSVAGIWRFKTNKLNQQYKDGIRYATGFKNTVGLTWNSKTNSLFLMNHGRDQLHDLFPQYYSAEQNNLLPSEVMYEVPEGADGGWPYIYYDHFQKKKILMPEYGGDGKKTGGENAINPVVTFPAHLAPNGLLFYTGNNYPAKYRNGAFIAFHAKSAELQKGYFVAFVPFNNGKPSGKWEIFAENFAVGTDVHKPCGLVQAPDGSIFVSDDAKGTIYRVHYKG